MFNRICIYCGSNNGNRSDYRLAAHTLASYLAKRGIGIVYGGGKRGMMGEIANAALDAGGEVIGVTPPIFIDMDVIHNDLTELHVVDTMHDRKSMMAELSDGFIALPGGLGTLDELFEILTWGQLGIHDKPCAVLNVCNYYTKLLEFLEVSVSEKYLNPKHLEMLIVDTEPKRILEKFEQYSPPKVSKLLDRP